MSLFNISFDTDSDSKSDSKRNNDAIKKIPNQTPKPKTEENKSVSNSDQNMSKKSPRTPTRTVRYVTKEDEILSTPKKPVPLAPDGLITIKIVREKRTKIGGTRLYFTGYQNSDHLYLAKAKKQNSKLIPITDSNKIHLRNKERSLAMLEMDNENSDFLLYENGPVKHHLMVVKFNAPKLEFDGMRKMHITFIGHTDLPSPVVSLPLTSVAPYEGRYMMYSIKNAVLVDDSTKTPIITIRKTKSKQLEIDTHFDIPKLWLFGLGIASFLGKKPTK
ncbi:hypothetical protein TRFO_40417 [Tritrichomonas foetus]|uniref:Tubby C-terminal domain-containing protein n=1 Tax=Tritrichomonas foetus TaxID=1144522 RepID=A0A1J4J0V4_9EUKA|nr:hypothetical protein TRFO_40417 [Tritrichomonas foetus]|eukprot:OHS93262.1 hypothetical protein TRFO_40417 [Tritrichomonas foetus]